MTSTSHEPFPVRAAFLFVHILCALLSNAGSHFLISTHAHVTNHTPAIKTTRHIIPEVTRTALTKNSKRALKMHFVYIMCIYYYILSNMKNNMQ